MKMCTAFAILLAALFMTPPIPAHADGDWWDSSPRQVHRRHYRRKPRAPAVAAWREREEDFDRDRSPRCLSVFIDVTSTEHTNAENGMEAAKKMWMAKTQWHHGSKYMDVDNAGDYRAGCSKSNAMDTMSGRLSEATNKLIGQEGQNVRCVIVARPCRMQLEKQEGHK